MRNNSPGRGHGSQRSSAHFEEGSAWMLPSRLCYCGNTDKVQTSWTTHPGRRFHACARKNGCRLWEWDVPQMCGRSKQIILGLLRKINKLEDEKNA
ncbi:hypothetical protein ACE6H2_019982 [Prunus campanulata]